MPAHLRGKSHPQIGLRVAKTKNEQGHEPPARKNFAA